VKYPESLGVDYTKVIFSSNCGIKK